MDNNILVDSSFFIALALPKDPNHKKAVEMAAKALQKESLFFTNAYIFAESMTMTLLRTKDIKWVKKLKESIFEQYVKIMKIDLIDDNFQKQIYEAFINQRKFRGEFLSFVDCSLLIQSRKNNIKTIFTFDSTFLQFPKEFQIIGASTQD